MKLFKSLVILSCLFLLSLNAFGEVYVVDCDTYQFSAGIWEGWRFYEYPYSPSEIDELSYRPHSNQARELRGKATKYICDFAVIHLTPEQKKRLGLRYDFMGKPDLQESPIQTDKPLDRIAFEKPVDVFISSVNHSKVGTLYVNMDGSLEAWRECLINQAVQACRDLGIDSTKKTKKELFIIFK